MAAGREDSELSGVRADILAVDMQGKVQSMVSIIGAEQWWPDASAPIQACTSSTATTLVAGSGTEQTASWDSLNSIDVAGGDGGTDFQNQTLADVARLEQVSKGAVTLNLLTSQNGMPRCAILPNPVDISTTLIEYWFTHVCQMWSTFDSDVNYNRQVATVNCTTSEVVFYALQSMSAACLLEITPSFKDSLSLIIS